MMLEPSVIVGLVRFVRRPVTRKVVGDQRTSRLAQQFDDAGAFPGVGEGSGPSVHENERSFPGHSG